MDDSFGCLPQFAGGRGWILVLPLLFGLLAESAQAQEPASTDSARFRPYQVGVSAGAFVEILGDANAPEQYQVYGRYRMTRDWALPAALRYRQPFSEGQDLDLGVRIGSDHVLRPRTGVRRDGCRRGVPPPSE